MIEFIQDYVTKALPREAFTDGQQVERSAESELYLVRLGVAGYLVDGKLVDQDYLPITRQTVVVVATTDRRFSDAGRGGETIGLEAPQRATSGPGNEVLFAGKRDGTTFGSVEFEQLRGDLAASASQFEQYQATSESEVERLKGLIDAATDAFHKADTAFGEERTTLVGERDQALADLKDSRSQHESLVLEYQSAQKQVAELERLLAEANKPDAKPSRNPK